MQQTDARTMYPAFWSFSVKRSNNHTNSSCRRVTWKSFFEKRSSSVCKRTHTHINTRTHTHRRRAEWDTCNHKHTIIHHMCTHTHAQAYIHWCTQMHTRQHKHAHKHTHMHARTHEFMPANRHIPGCVRWISQCPARWAHQQCSHEWPWGPLRVPPA